MKIDWRLDLCLILWASRTKSSNNTLLQWEHFPRCITISLQYNAAKPPLESIIITAYCYSRVPRFTIQECKHLTTTYGTLGNFLINTLLRYTYIYSRVRLARVPRGQGRGSCCPKFVLTEVEVFGSQVVPSVPGEAFVCIYCIIQLGKPART